MFATATLEGATESREPKLAEIAASTGTAATVAALSCVPAVGTRRNEKDSVTSATPEGEGVWLGVGLLVELAVAVADAEDVTELLIVALELDDDVEVAADENVAERVALDVEVAAADIVAVEVAVAELVALDVAVLVPVPVPVADAVADIVADSVGLMQI